MNIDLIVKMQFGSHVYGTSVPTSDQDFKGVYLPSRGSILLGRVQDTIVRTTKNDLTAKNTADDTDLEIFSLKQFLKLVIEGQTCALDMVFTPRSFYIGKPSPAWEAIQKHKFDFLHSGITAYFGYARTQAAKYGIKGSRVNAVRRSLEFVKKYPPQARLKDYEKDIRAFAQPGDLLDSMLNSEPLIKITPILHKNRKIMEDHFEVCNRKFGFTATFKYVTERLQEIFDEYGHRARLAETNQGVDWKALMHAVRVCEEAKELLTTGTITFPRPEKDLLLKIRKGELPYKQVAELIEQGLVDIEDCMEDSALPDSPDKQLADDIVTEFYGKKASKLFPVYRAFGCV